MGADWEKLSTRAREDYRIFSVREDRLRSPRNGHLHDFYILEVPDWVNIIPITPEGKVVCVRQYRHGIAQETLEIPGGVVDTTDLSLAETAERELQEETGYQAEKIVYLGDIAPNPAVQNNRCASFVALNARPVTQQQLDPAEDIEVVLVDLAEIPLRIASGDMQHALVVVAFYLLGHHQRQHPTLYADYAWAARSSAAR